MGAFDKVGCLEAAQKSDLHSKPGFGLRDRLRPPQSYWRIVPCIFIEGVQR